MYLLFWEVFINLNNVGTANGFYSKHVKILDFDYKVCFVNFSEL